AARPDERPAAASGHGGGARAARRGLNATRQPDEPPPSERRLPRPSRRPQPARRPHAVAGLATSPRRALARLGSQIRLAESEWLPRRARNDRHLAALRSGPSSPPPDAR